MVIYIASYNNSQFIQESITEVNRTILYEKVTSDFCIQDFIKQQLEKLQATKTLIIDLTSLKDSEEDLLDALNGFRLINDNLQIIIVAPYKRSGDKLLGEIFNMGIYDIVAFEDEEQEAVKKKVQECLKERRKYKDSIIYKTDVSEEGKEKDKKVIKEKVIIKTETSVSKALIGVIGVQQRIGVTHNCIVSANYLRKQGYSVAILEDSQNQNKIMNRIMEIEDVDVNTQENFFTYQKVDYYPNYDTSESYKIQAKGYNFIFIDFGMYYPGMNLIELNRCVKAIVLLGSKPWEIGEANNLFMSVDTNLLENYSYIFNFTAKDNEKFLRESMGSLKNVYFADYTPDPFNNQKSETIEKVFAEYVNGTRDKPSRKNIFNKIFGG